MKVVFITGGSSGIGRATARVLVAKGFKVALFARSTEKLAALRDEMGHENVLALTGDVTVQADLETAVAKTIETFGRLDSVFVNAGIMLFDEAATGDPDDWAKLVEVNILGVMRTVRATAPTLIAQGLGDVVLTSSIAGRYVWPDSIEYAGTKHFVYGYGVGLRKQLAKHGIRVGIVSPGYTMNELWGAEATDPAAQKTATDAQEALVSEDIAEAVAYMLMQPKHVNVADMLILPTKQDVPYY